MTSEKIVDFPHRLQHIKSVLTNLSKRNPGVTTSFGHLHKEALETGALDVKTKEIIALAIAVASRCDGCIAFHTHDALRAGATESEITDALGVAVMMGGGPALVYATHVVDAMEQFQDISGSELHAVNPRKTTRSAYVESCHHFD